MAELKPKPRKSRTQPKYTIYQSLFNLNSAFESIAREIEGLDDYETVPVETLWRYRMTAEELRAGMNHRILGILSNRELKEWTQFAKQLRERAQQE